MGDYHVKNGIIYVQTIGKNLKDENDPVVRLSISMAAETK
jgi:hypothetical protein